MKLKILLRNERNYKAANRKKKKKYFVNKDVIYQKKKVATAFICKKSILVKPQTTVLLCESKFP